MIQLLPEDASDFATRILTAAGASDENAQVVAAHLVDSDRHGIGSHGLNRVSQYVAEIEAGTLDPAVAPTAVDASSTTTHIDGQHGFGQVACEIATSFVAEKVSAHGMAFATVRNVGHTGRLGRYTARLAEAGHVAMCFAAGARKFHWMAPYGAREGRMSTNPISWAAPSSDGPLVADFSTSSVPEGRVRMWRDTGTPVAPDALADNTGMPSTNPDDLYTNPRGVLLPLGGIVHGHKGYALALLVETMATLMAGDLSAATSDERGNNLSILGIGVDASMTDRVTASIAYMKSATPTDPDRPVLVPGEIERRHATDHHSIRLAEATWTRLVEIADRYSLTVPTPTTSHPDNE